MKRFWQFILCVLLLCSMLSASVFADSPQSFGWYCPHVKNHVQPATGSELKFVEKHGGYYLGNSDEKVIYLTFDAGYENGNVEKILDILKENEVPAAFFVLEHFIKSNSVLVERMNAEGHLICNHTAHHGDMSKMSDEEFLRELHSLEDTYQELYGRELSKFYRPPEGRFSEANLLCAEKNGYKTIFWSFAYPDWDNQRQICPARAEELILANAHPGEVMLLHPTSSTNAKVLGNVIQKLKADGYRFGSLEELTQ